MEIPLFRHFARLCSAMMPRLVANLLAENERLKETNKKQLERVDGIIEVVKDAFLEMKCVKMMVDGKLVKKTEREERSMHNQQMELALRALGQFQTLELKVSQSKVEEKRQDVDCDFSLCDDAKGALACLVDNHLSGEEEYALDSDDDRDPYEVPIEELNDCNFKDFRVLQAFFKLDED